MEEEERDLTKLIATHLSLLCYTKEITEDQYREELRRRRELKEEKSED
jgi:hypothetical protein